MDDIREKLDVIMNNHLPHIQAKVDEHDWKLKLILYVLGAVFVAAVGQYFK